jgi:very-short-patch-repair endonuclease
MRAIHSYSGLTAPYGSFLTDWECLMPVDVDAINYFLQEQLAYRGIYSVGAIEAACWLDEAGLLQDSTVRPGLPLRKLLRTHRIVGQRQESNGRWYVDLVSAITSPDHNDITSEQHVPPRPTGDRPQKSARRQASASQRDEAYVVDLCDELLGQKALRQHKFAFLRGDAGTRLPVDAYYPDLRLVIEYREPQHTRPNLHFDKPDRLTVSGVHRGEQRALYDQRRRDVLPQHGIDLLEIAYDELSHNAKGRLVRDRASDLRILRQLLARWLARSE